MTRFRPRVGVILGSGLGAVADAVEDPQVVGYEELSGLPAADRRGARRPGRARRDRRRAGRGAARAARTSTRAVDSRSCAHRSAALQAAGAEILVLTNAAGSLRPEVGPGR